MELVLNRIKSEFALVRFLLYQSVIATNDRLDSVPYESTYTDLLDNEVSGLRPEMLRSSVRLCFGILDRIAFGICDLLNVDIDPKRIDFFRVMLGPKYRSVLEANCTASLVALYSQATDLSIKGGQWGHFKDWRNAIEHRFLFLTIEGKDLGPLVNPSDFGEALAIEYVEFATQAEHLVRFVAHSILHFTFFVRQIALREKGSSKGEKFYFDKKPIGPK